MSEVHEQQPKTLQSVTQEYYQVAAQLGNAYYVLKIAEKECVPKMESLNIEAAKIKEKDAAQVQAPPPPPVDVLPPVPEEEPKTV